MEKKKNTTQTFPVEGMSCAACAARVEKTLKRQTGVCQATVNYAAANATVEYDSAQCSPESLQQAVQAVGYDLIIRQEEAETETLEAAHRQQYHTLKMRTGWAITLSLPVTLISMFGMQIPGAGIIVWLLSTPVVFWLGRGFFISAWKQLKHRSANMDTLVANSTGIAYLFSLFNLFFPEFWLSRGIEPHVYFEASSVIISFILLGRLLEERAKGNTSAAIKKLMGLQPLTVTRLADNGQPQEIAIDAIRPGDLLIAKPGERVAVDGTVIEGNSYVDESMLSGEPTAIAKQPADKVFAGTINQKGSFRYRADKVGTETLLAHIIRMVQEAQGSKAPMQRLVDKIAGIFVPIIIGIALLTFIVWMVLDGENGFTHGVLALVTVLIIACPCALGLATPTAIMVGIGKGAERGILIKDAESLESACRINAIVLDKTGTLTAGKPSVKSLVWSKQTNEEAKAIFRSLEQQSEHPLAEALTQYLQAYQTVETEHFESLTGLGVTGRHKGRTYYVGNHRLLQQHAIGIAPELEAEARRLATTAQTIIWLADEKQALGVAGISDPIKSTSATAVRQMQEAGIEVYLLTGDNEVAARETARQTGIRHYRAGMLPASKAAFIRELQATGKRVGMVGDGINDSAALALADLSIAMGSGSDIAMETAQMTLIASDPAKIPEALKLSRLTVRTIRQNLFWAFIYNLIGVPLAAGVLYPLNGFLLNPMIAGAAMAFSSVSVVSNSLRLKRYHSFYASK